MATPLLTNRPAEPAEGSVIRFNMYGGYSYAAIRIENLWFITQGKMARVSPREWDLFLDWVGPENWSSLELMD